MRWPGQVEANSVANEIVHHMDWLPTFVAVAGDPDIKEKLKKGHKVGDNGTSEFAHGPFIGDIDYDSSQVGIHLVADQVFNLDAAAAESRQPG